MCKYKLPGQPPKRKKIKLSFSDTIWWSPLRMSVLTVGGTPDSFAKLTHFETRFTFEGASSILWLPKSEAIDDFVPITIGHSK
jgi:hypothetical protein